MNKYDEQKMTLQSTVTDKYRAVQPICKQTTVKRDLI